MKASFLYFLSLTAILASHVATAQTLEDVEKHPVCIYCEMNRGHYAHSRMLLEYVHGSIGVCSVHCAAMHLALNIEKELLSIKVADYNGKELIDAESAFWVIGGNRPGVMTQRAKWAFKEKKDAEKFISKNGGSPATFDEVLAAAYRDMYEDSKMIRGKRKIRKMHR